MNRRVTMEGPLRNRSREFSDRPFSKGRAWLLACLMGLRAIGLSAGAEEMRESPVIAFRELLNMTPELRRERLSDKPVGTRERLLEKLAEYDHLPVEERERRLSETNAQWYLRQLLLAPEPLRRQMLSQMPAPYQPLLSERLEKWDALPDELKGEVLRNQWMINFILQARGKSPSEREALLKAIPDEERRRLEERLEAWNKLPEAKQARLHEQLADFVEMSAEERRRLLKSLPPGEQAATDSAIDQLEKIDPRGRTAVVDAFKQLSEMTDTERAVFFRNAARWKAMSEAERETWRRLVTRIPPLPPGAGQGPPLPPGFIPTRLSPVPSVEESAPPAADE